MRRFFLLLLFLAAATASAQLVGSSTGANRSDVSWHRIETAHFTIIYHDGLDSVVREAADVAEAVYPVVTGNLGVQMSGRTDLYLSDLDEVANAFAYDDSYMFIWMRGILDDMPLGGVRSAGRAKWFRAVITHEFTHIVIAHAAGTPLGDVIPLFSFNVPRWFNEGTARFMEPDGWTTDLDMVLRVAAVNGSLGYDLLAAPDAIDGTLLYETGHSIVRYMTERFGDSVLGRILKFGAGTFGFDFNRGVEGATGMSMSEIYGDWLRAVTVLYGTEYGGRTEISDLAPPVTRRFPVVTGIRYSPDRGRIALLAGDLGSMPESRGQRLYLMRNDSTALPEMIFGEPGIDDEFSWSPDGRSIVFSKFRRGSHRELLHDLYIIDADSRDVRRLTSDAGISDPVWSPDGGAIIAVQKRIGRDNLVLVDPFSGAVRPLTRFSGDRQIYAPSWSPDGSRIAFSLFDEGGNRSIATIGRDGDGLRLLTADSANNRYPVWSPDGSRIAFTSHAGGVPNLQVMNADGSARRFITDVAGGIYSVQWLPGTDSVVAISFDTRRRIQPHLIPASGVVEPAAVQQVQSKYTAWRTVRFPRQVPPAGEIAGAALEGPYGYSSFLALRPLIPVLPQVLPDLSRDGRDYDFRLGLGTLWNDPMGKHLLFGVADYGLGSREPGGELYYVNNQLPVSVTFHGEYTLGWEGHLAGGRYDYYQRNRNVKLELGYRLPAPNTLSVGHEFWVGARSRNLEPWAIASNSGDDTVDQGILLSDLSLRSLHAHLTELSAGYRYSSRTLLVQGSYLRSEPGLGSDLGYHRARLTGSFRLPLFGNEGFALLGNADGMAQWGEQLPQERVGLEDYQYFRYAWIGIAELPRAMGNYSLRGVDAFIYGDRVLIASLALQTRLPILERLLPILMPLRPQVLLFAETGAAWYADSTSLGSIPFASSIGAELRAETLPNVWASFGGAAGLGRYDDGFHPYLRLTFGL